MGSAAININNNFFNGIYKDVWRKIIPAGLSEAEIEFIIDIANLKGEQSVLDLMCGYGRHTIGLAKKGIRVTAVDNQPAYINEIIEGSENNKFPVRAVQSDVVAYFPDQQFDAVICMGNSFAFFNKEDATEICRRVAACLSDNGVFIINSWMIAEIAIRHFKEKDWFYVGEYKYLLDYKFCFHPNRIESEQTIIAPDGSIESNEAVDYIFSLNELSEIFNNTGLRIRETFATPRKKKFSLGDGQVYIVIEKV